MKNLICFATLMLSFVFGTAYAVDFLSIPNHGHGPVIPQLPQG